MTSFNTTADMYKAGYKNANAHIRILYKDVYIISVDTDGNDSIGYEFAIKIETPSYERGHPYKHDKNHCDYCFKNFNGDYFAVSKPVSIKRSDGRYGIEVVYHPDDYKNAIANAKSVIDEYRKLYPDYNYFISERDN